jgi:molybdopterin biosynthesis enzyme
MLSSMVASEGFVVLGEETTRVEPGEPVEYIPFSGLLA